MVEMQVHLQPVATEVSGELKTREREMAQGLQRDGRWRHLWRVAGCYANVRIVDVSSPDELHELRKEES